ncbi:MAG: TRIC cation channel family protein [Clostridia bacterium]|nr:TRIC cation channel family protein [Clostridia bacterium]
MNIDTVFFALELIGTAAFSVTGVITALEKKLDIFGAAVLSMVTAVGGGMLRDIILGYLPPVAFRKSVYSIVALSVSVLVYVISYFADKDGVKIKDKFDVYTQVINVFDSVGLAVFTIGGINSAHSCGFTQNAYLCIFVGLLTGVGGGVMRDVLAGRVPVILKKRIYAVAAIAGALLYQILTEHKLLSSAPAILLSVCVILVIRILATVFRWNLPSIKDYSRDGDKDKED